MGGKPTKKLKAQTTSVLAALACKDGKDGEAPWDGDGERVNCDWGDLPAEGREGDV